MRVASRASIRRDGVDATLGLCARFPCTSIAVPGTEASVPRPRMEFLPDKSKKRAFRPPGGQEYETTLVKQ